MIVKIMKHKLNELSGEESKPKLYGFDIADYLKGKGIDFIETGKWLKMKCILPTHDDQNPSFYIHTEHLGFNCYGCGEKGNLDKLFELMGWSHDSHLLLDVVSKGDWYDFMKDDIDEECKVRTFRPPVNYKPLLNGNGSAANFWKYLNDRKLTFLLKTFAIYYASNAKDDDYGYAYKNRILIPVHDIYGKYLWMEGRSIDKRNKKVKYYRPKGVDKNKHLYNIHKVIRLKYKHVIVVEGIIDAMILWVLGFPAVCSFGANLSDPQIEILLNFDEVILAFDNNKAGIKGYVKAKDKMLGTGVGLGRVILKKNVDANDMIISNRKKTLIAKFMNPLFVV